MCKYPIHTLKQCTYLTYHHFSPNSHMGSEFIVCNMGGSLEITIPTGESTPKSH